MFPYKIVNCCINLSEKIVSFFKKEDNLEDNLHFITKEYNVNWRTENIPQGDRLKR